MTARSGVIRGNPGPGSSRTPFAAAQTGSNRPVSPSHEYSRPRRPQR